MSGWVLRCLPGTITALLNGYAPVQNKKFEIKNKRKRKAVDLQVLGKYLVNK